MRRLLLASAALLVGASAASAELLEFQATAETAPVPFGGASLVTIWHNAANPAESRILGTDEDGALLVFALDGSIVQTIEGEGPTGIDIRYGVDVDGTATDIAALGDGQNGAVQFFAIGADGMLSPIGEAVTPSVDAVIVCLYRSSFTGMLNLFALNGDGEVGQYEVTLDGAVALEELRTFDVGGETSSCVADDFESTLYIGEEETGIWSYAAEPDASRARILVDAAMPTDTRLREVEGLALLAAAEGQGGYLFAADEAQQAILVYDRGTYAYLGGFTLGEGAVDAVDDPHGIAVLGLPLGGAFNGGLLVVEDDAEDDGAPTFKLVSLAEVLSGLGLAAIEPRDPRAVLAAAAAVLPIAETTPVGSRGDAADDPAIWFNPEDPEGTLIVGTDKQSGLGVYNLDGELLNFYAVGQINNVDLRTVTVNGVDRVIVAATNRVDQTLVVMELSPDGTLIDILAGPIAVAGGEAYGFCLYKAPDGSLHGYANTTAAVISHIPFAFGADGRVSGTTTQTWQLETQTEGCVVDDTTGELFVGEETRGIWRFDLTAADPSAGTLVFEATDTGPLVADVEGLALWDYDGKRYLVASSQGSDRYIIIDRADWSFAGAFRIIADRSEGIDGATETDGLEIVFTPLDDEDFALGIMVAQDGLNDDEPQNFKIVTLVSVVEALGWAN